MKKVLFYAVSFMFTVMLILLSDNAMAQPPAPEDMAKQETELMKSQLNLNAAQLTKVEAINLKYAQKMGEMFSAGPGGDFAEMEKKMTAIEIGKRGELEKILTSDQLKKYDAMVIEQRNNRPGPPM